MPFAAQDGSVTSNPKWENLQLWICAKITDSELDVSGNLVDKYFVSEIAKPISSDIELSISYVMNLLSKFFVGAAKHGETVLITLSFSMPAQNKLIVS